MVLPVSAGLAGQFLRWIGLFSAAVTLIAVLRYHADVAAPPPPPPPSKEKDLTGKKDATRGTFVVDEVRDPNTGEMTKVNRMCGTGIFNDPNDFALILVTAIPLGLYWLTDRASPMMRPSRSATNGQLLPSHISASSCSPSSSRDGTRKSEKLGVRA